MIYKINLGRDLARLDIRTDAFTKTDECNDMNSSQISTRINKKKYVDLVGTSVENFSQTV